MNRRQIKQHLVELLLERDLARIGEAILQFPETAAVNALFSCLCDPRETVRWHAVSAFGFLLPGIASRDMEAARTIMRRFLWMLNDESGGIGWGVPEAMAETMVSCPQLAGEYLHMLVSYTLDDGPELFQHGNFVELERLQEGVLWGLCRTAPNYRSRLLELGLSENLGIYFQAGSAAVRGLACRLCGLLALVRYRDELQALLSEQVHVRFYHDGVFMDTTVSAMAETALAELE